MKMSFLGVLLLVFGTYSAAAAEPARLSRADKAEIAKQVKSVFKNKCAKCHEPEGVRTFKKPNADFDYVLDLKKLGSNPELIVRGDPMISYFLRHLD
jgi:mono/diheme cytochrome c family protein